MYATIRNYIQQNYILAAIILVAAAWFVWQIKFLLALFFIAFLIVIGFLPLTRRLRGKGLPNVLAVLIPYAIAAVAIAFIVAPFFSQIAAEFQRFLEQLAASMGDLPALRAQAQSLGVSIQNLSGNIVGFVTAVSTTITLSIYAQLDYERLRRVFLHWAKTYIPRVETMWEKLERDLSAWINGQIILCITIGVLVWILLTILDMPFASSLALFAGLLEVLPTVGPIIAAIPAVLLGLQESFAKGMIVMCVYIGIQFLENTIIVPRVMNKAVNMHTLVIIPALIIGYQFLGILGAMLAIPALVTARIVWRGIRPSPPQAS